MKTSHSIAVVLAGAVAGFLFSRFGDVGAAPSSEAAVMHTTKARPTMAKEKAPPPRTLAGLVESMRKAGGLPEGVVDDVARLPSDTLRERLVSLAAVEVPGGTFLTPAEKWYAGLDALAEELFHREGEASILWAESTGDPDLTAALLRAAADDPSLVKKWMLKLALTWDPDRQEGWRVFRRVAEIATSRGSDSLLEAEALFPQSMPDLPAGYPADFDFAGYLAKTQSDKGRANAVKAWAVRDPHPVAALLVEKAKSGGFDVREVVASAAMEGVAMAGDDASVVKWLEGWTAELPEGTRKDLLSNLVRNETRQDLAVALVAGLSSPEDRMAVAASGLRFSWNEGMDAYVRALPDATERQGALGRWWQGLPAGMRASQRAKMEQTLDQLDLPPAEKGTLRAQMTGQ